MINDFSAGGYQNSHLLNSHYDAGDMYRAYDFDAAIIHMGANDAGNYKTATTFKSETLQVISMIRGWMNDPNYKIILMGDPDLKSWISTDVRRERFAEFPGAQEEIALADPNILVVNSRRLADDLYNWRYGHPKLDDYLADFVHYAPEGGRVLAKAEMDALFGLIGPPPVMRTVHSDLTGPGSVSPSADVQVVTGETAQVIYTADPGNAISAFLTDGVSVPAATGLVVYTSTHVNVQADITNTVVFASDGSGVDPGGMLDPALFTVTTFGSWSSAPGIHALNGAGLTGNTHNDTATDTWLSLGSVIDGKWIKVDLGGTFTLDHLRVWNFNMAGGEWRGLKQADIYVALTDPGNNIDENATAFDPTGWTLAVADQIFAPSPGGSAITNTDANIALGLTHE